MNLQGRKPLDLAGKRFGSLVAISRSTKRTSNKSYMWNCVCDCGNKVKAGASSLNGGEKNSCGCLTERNRHEGRANKMVRLYGTYMSCIDPWYIRAAAIRQRCRANNIPFGFKSVVDLALYLRSIAPETCPVFGVKFVNGTKTMHKWSPSVDKIVPEKGYCKDNLQVISYLANSMKRDATLEQLEKFALWILKLVAQRKRLRGEIA